MSDASARIIACVVRVTLSFCSRSKVALRFVCDASELWRLPLLGSRWRRRIGAGYVHVFLQRRTRQERGMAGERAKAQGVFQGRQVLLFQLLC